MRNKDHCQNYPFVSPFFSRNSATVRDPPAVGSASERSPAFAGILSEADTTVVVPSHGYNQVQNQLAEIARRSNVVAASARQGADLRKVEESVKATKVALPNSCAPVRRSLELVEHQRATKLKESRPSLQQKATESKAAKLVKSLGEVSQVNVLPVHAHCQSGDWPPLVAKASNDTSRSTVMNFSGAVQRVNDEKGEGMKPALDLGMEPNFQILKAQKRKQEPESSTASFAKSLDEQAYKVPLETSPKLEMLKVLAARALGKSPMADQVDYKELRNKLGAWFPPLPTGEEQRRLIQEVQKDAVPLFWPGMSRAQRKKGRKQWLTVFTRVQANMRVEDSKETALQAATSSVSEINSSSIALPAPAPSPKPMPKAEQLQRNSKIIHRENSQVVREIRRYRPLVTRPVQTGSVIAASLTGGVNLTQKTLPKYKGTCGTVLCYLKSPVSDTLVKVRVLLDSGAEVTMLERESAKKANIRGEDVQMSIGVAGGGCVTHTLQEAPFQLLSMDRSYCSPPMIGYASPAVGTPFQPVNFNPKQHGYLKGLEIAESFPNCETRPINIILGEPYFTMLEEDEVRMPPDSSLPKAVKTKLGWVLRGATEVLSQVPIASAYSMSAMDNEIFDLETMQKSMGFDFRLFWTGENIGLSPHESMHSDLTALEIRANEFHAETARYDPTTRRWKVRLPWIEEGLEAHRLSDNMSRATAFYYSAMAKVKPEQMPYVISAYEELVEKGIVEEVPQEELVTEHPNYVMTSRPVFRMDRSTTKCRIVINASLPDHKNKMKPGNTLNKMLMPGPNKLPQIMELVLKLMFLEHIFLIDVKKMFLSVDLALTSDKDMLRYLWAKPGEPLKVYRHKTLAFGVISSPYQAMSSLHDTAKLLEKEYPEAAEAIQANTYMDDNSGGANDLDTAKKLLSDILVVMESGGFIGHKIAASHPALVEGIPEDRLDPARVVSILGLKLDLNTSEFMFDLDDKFSRFDANADIITRRDIVAVASMIFDTQGFVSPYIMQYKKLLPLLWHKGTKWDDNLIGKIDKETGELDLVAEQSVKGFRAWISDVNQLKELRFPRNVEGVLDSIAIFGDASKTGIGCVAYAIKLREDGTRRAHIIYSKSSLMPKNLRSKAEAQDALTIARAELIGMLNCFNMSEYIQNALKPNLPTSKIHVFTDSLLNLQRVQRGIGKSKPWEERRVLKILERKGDSTISFCPGVLNPADLPSRGCDMADLKNRFEFWSQGPEFLTLPRSQWPKQPSPAEKIANENVESAGDNMADPDVGLYMSQLHALLQSDIECRNILAASSQVEEQPEETFLTRLMERFSSPRKARAVMTYCRRFIQKARKQKGTEPEPTASKENLPALPNYKCGVPITVDEARQADIIFAREAQRQHLSKEMDALKEAQEKDDQNDKPVVWKVKFASNSPLKHLAVYYDPKDKLIRLRTRLHLSSTIPFDTTNPIVLPKCKWGEQLLLEIHQDRYHCSQRQTFNEMKKRFWMLGGFSYVKEKVRKLCLTPRCRFRQYESPKMSPLPEIRMDKAVAWRHVGVDYIGPIVVKHDCNEKQYGQQKCASHDMHKVWGAVFTCMTSRSVNVELIKSCTTVDFLGAFRRHVADHGRPDTFYSDQAKNFTAADKQLKQVLLKSKDEVRNFTYADSHPITWRYSSPTAPWANGCTERLVGIFKKQLQIALQKIPLTMDQLTTISKEICACVNDRPLGVIEQGSDDLQITPNMLVRGRPNTPLRTVNDQTLSMLPYAEQWISRRKELKGFWDRWQSEYLATLSVDNKWVKGQSSMIKPGDVVTIKPETLGKNQWRIARVMEVHKNQDGLVTTATVKMPNGTVLRRTLRQLALLEASFEDLGKPDRVVIEKPVISTPQDTGPVDTSYAGPSGITERGGSGSDVVREQKAHAQYSGEEGVTPSTPVPATPDPPQEPRGHEGTGERRGKRARKDPGYYLKLAKGNYACQNAQHNDAEESE